MFNILTTPSIFHMDRKNYGQQEEERWRRREREIRSYIRDQDRSDLLSEHRRVVVTQKIEGSGVCWEMERSLPRAVVDRPCPLLVGI